MIKKVKRFFSQNYQEYTGYISLRIAFLLVFLAIMTSTIGLMLIDNYSFVEAFYMTIITISTVGFTEVKPLSSTGQLFISIMIVFNIGIYIYGTTAFSKFVIQGELFKLLHMDLLNQDISKLRNHTIICGYGKYGREIAQQLSDNNIPFVIIEREEDKATNIRTNHQNYLYIKDDATHDETLIKAGIYHAKALISSLSEDADNVFTVLTARQLNSSLNIISRAIDARTEKKLLLAGANRVILTERIGGFHMASLIINPVAVDFFASLIEASVDDILIESFTNISFVNHCQNRTLKTLEIREKTGANVVAIKTSQGYLINPSSDTLVEPDKQYIILGSKQQLQDFKKEFIL